MITPGIHINYGYVPLVRKLYAFFIDYIILPDPCKGNDCFEPAAVDKCENKDGTCMCTDANLEIIEGKCQGEF